MLIKCVNGHSAVSSCGWALWQMTESEEELRSLCAAATPPCTYSSAARRIEYYAVRALLATVLGADKAIAYEPSGRPYLTDHSCYISISHTKGVCALAWHSAHPVGVDVEQVADRVSRVAHRFVSPAEQCGVDTLFPADRTLGHLLLWSAKEAAYKVAGQPATDFLQDIVVDFSTLDAEAQTCSVLCRADVPGESTQHMAYPLMYCFYPHFVLVIVGMETGDGMQLLADCARQTTEKP